MADHDEEDRRARAEVSRDSDDATTDDDACADGHCETDGGLRSGRAAAESSSAAQASAADASSAGSPPPEAEILYFTDPMCSWCYGVGPEIEALAARFSNLPLAVIQGGLRPDERAPMKPGMAREIAKHWHHVQEASGKPFDFGFFERNPEFVYDTAPACRAVVAAGRADASKTLEYQHALQTLFYAEGQDPTKLATFRAAAERVGLDSEEFAVQYENPDSEQMTRQHFLTARGFGIHAYPSVVLHVGGKYILLARGFAKADDLAHRVEQLLARYGDSAQSAAT